MPSLLVVSQSRLVFLPTREYDYKKKPQQRSTTQNLVRHMNIPALKTKNRATENIQMCANSNKMNASATTCSNTRRQERLGAKELEETFCVDFDAVHSEDEDQRYQTQDG